MRFLTSSIKSGILDDLINNKRPANIEAIKEARSLGDLSENAEYDAARNEQAKIEARIKELEKMLENVSVIKDLGTDSVNIGNTVTIKYTDDDEEDELDDDLDMDYDDDDEDFDDNFEDDDDDL